MTEKSRKLSTIQPESLEEFLREKTSDHWDQLLKLKTDDVNSLVADLLIYKLEPGDVPMPNGKDYKDCSAGYLLALAPFLNVFLKAQNTVHPGEKSVVSSVYQRREGGESMGRWQWEGKATEDELQ
jgi:hypothetical protein